MTIKLSDLHLHDIGTSIQVLGTLYADARDGTVYAIPFPDVALDSAALGNAQILDMDLQDWQTFLHQTDKVEIIATVVDAHGKVGKAIVRKVERQISQRVSWAVFRRDHYRCRYCGTNDVPLSVDHLVLWEEGGPSTEENLVSACKKCNRTRGNTVYVDWLESRYYREVSRRLPPAIQEANAQIAHTLHDIPRHPLKGKRSRR